ncbi:hypothetical protein MKJ01_02690 [Chryseobacterium sp. SSA4.19]|uniref:hypothetical protein n=1 Tax=Chryseobacterium sp. SSA4.19 TaxID=2919915 RepID=UPI001F4DC4A5|nr:hypothetical protein [Chryseobacterium sp. SSA4.19]MCJ8152669.1 hypothetical protein [Chryseobacterium sp. SSA4.19]
MGTKLFLFSILLFAFIRLSGQNDGVYLNMRLYPVQILSIGSNGDMQDNYRQSSTDRQNEKYVTVSSTAGFEVNVQHMNDHDKMNIINSSRGSVQEIFTIDQDMQNIMRKMYSSSSLKSDYVFLTLISQ